MKDNPYVGPRPYERQDLHNFYGRVREARDLLALILANRNVLFYAQSGAGKTSLLNAQIIPALEERGFEVLPVARVGSDLPPGVDPQSVKNIFVLSVLMGLVQGTGQDVSAGEQARETLPHFLQMICRMQAIAASAEQDQEVTLAVTGARRPPILILDQFEEILTTHHERWQDAQGFFEQLAEAMRRLPELGVVLAMREDHVAGLDPYAALLPRRLKTRYRMERLALEGALEAVVKPALRAGAPFAPGVAERLVDDLRRIKTVSPSATGENVLGPYVEPVQLQVVCQQLWENLPDDLDHDIGWAEVERYGNIDRALTDFYESALAQTCQVSSNLTGLAVTERQLRRWFGEHLITPMQTRGLVLREQDQTADLPNSAVDVLENRHLIRAEVRAGSTWYELAHDRLVEPIVQSNRAWEAVRQTPLRTAAKRWQETKSESLLYRDKALKEARTWTVEHPAEVEPYEQEFLQASQNAERIRARTRRFAIVGAVALLVGLVATAWLAVVANQGQQQARWALAMADIRRAEADAQRQVAVTALAQAEEQGQIAVTALAQAQEQRQIAVTAQAKAEANAAARAAAEASALAQRDEAQRQAAVAFSRQLAAQAQGALNNQFALSLLLNVEARRATDTFEARGALLTAVQERPYLLQYLWGHQGNAINVAFSPTDNKLMASIGEDGIILWDLATRRPIDRLRTGDEFRIFRSPMAFSPDGKLLVVGDSNDIQLWDVATRAPVGRPFRAHVQGLYDLVFSPDGKLLASCGHAAQEDAYEIRLWDVATRQPLGQPLTGYKWISSVAFSPDGKMLASGHQEDGVLLWEVATRLVIGRLRDEKSYRVDSLAFSPDGRLLAAGGANNLVLWNVSNALNTNVATRQPVRLTIEERRYDGVTSLAFSPDSRTLAASLCQSSFTCDQGQIRLWNVGTGLPIGAPFVTRNKSSVRVAFSLDGKLLASNSEGDAVSLWDVTLRQAVGQRLDKISTSSDFPDNMAFSPDGKLIAANTWSDIFLFDALTRQPITTTPQRLPSWIDGLLFSPDSKALVTYKQQDKIFALWDVATRSLIGQPITVSQYSSMTNLTDLVFRPDGQWLAIGGTGESILWDVAARQLVGQPIKGTAYAVAFSPDGKLLALGDYPGIILWDTTTRQPIGEPLRGHFDSGSSVPAASLAFSPAGGGRMLASAASDKLIILWDVSTRQPIGQPFKGHGKSVRSVAFSPDGQVLASTEGDNTIWLWDVAARRPFGLLKGPLDTYVYDLAFGPAEIGAPLASMGRGVVLWDVNVESWQARACAMVGRNLTRAEWRQYLPGLSYRQTCEQWPPEPELEPTPTPTPTRTRAPTRTPTPTATPTPKL